MIFNRSCALVPALLLALTAGCSSDSITGGPAVELTDAQRTSIAHQLVTASAASGEGSIAATFAAAALVAGAPVRTVSAGAEASNYLAVAAQVIETGSSDVTSVIVAWRPGPDGSPTDVVLTLSSGTGPSGFAATANSAPAAFGLLYTAPSALWVAAGGSTSLRRTGTGTQCRDIGEPLSESGFQGSCNLAIFDAAVDITSSGPAQTAGNTAQGSTTFNLSASQLGGVVINVTGPAVVTSRAIGR